MLFESMPAVVELFGHQRIAGKVSEVQIGGSSLVRVDVPAVEGQPGFTKFYGTSAIYAVTPCDEETMLRAVQAFRAVPIEAWRLEVATRPALSPGDDYDDDGDSSYE
jgi:hypothetical protein